MVPTQYQVNGLYERLTLINYRLNYLSHIKSALILGLDNEESKHLLKVLNELEILLIEQRKAIYLLL